MKKKPGNVLKTTLDQLDDIRDVLVEIQDSASAIEDLVELPVLESVRVNLEWENPSLGVSFDWTEPLPNAPFPSVVKDMTDLVVSAEMDQKAGESRRVLLMWKKAFEDAVKATDEAILKLKA